MANHQQTAIVTGASGGLGAAISKALLARGFNVVLNGRNEERLATAYDTLGKPDAALPVAGDVGNAAERARLVEAGAREFAVRDRLALCSRKPVQPSRRHSHSLPPPWRIKNSALRMVNESP